MTYGVDCKCDDPNTCQSCTNGKPGATVVLEPGQTLDWIHDNTPYSDGIGPGLTEHQKEMLVRFIQEAGEVVQSATKLLLFGQEATDPHTNMKYDNVRDLSLEVGDLHQMTEELNTLALILPGAVAQGIARKQVNLGKYLITKRPEPE